MSQAGLIDKDKTEVDNVCKLLVTLVQNGAKLAKSRAAVKSKVGPSI